MIMERQLEIILPMHNPGPQLARTVASLLAQIDQLFSVLLSDNYSRTGLNHLDAAQEQLAAAGILVRRLKPPYELKRLEHWNWAHARSQADWLKLLQAGEELKPAYVQRMRQRISERPKAQLIRCDLEMRTEWGFERMTAPFDQDASSPAEFLNYFPAHVAWVSRSSNFACTRTAWLAMGGYSTHLPACAALNLNVILALHYGLENLAETLVTAELADGSSLNENHGERVNLSLELWLILRQARNYCLAAKLPWSKRWLFLRGLTAALGRW